MGLPKTQQECLLFSWEILFKDNKKLFQLVHPVWQGCPSALSKYTFRAGTFTKTKACFQQDGGYSNSGLKTWFGIE